MVIKISSRFAFPHKSYTLQISCFLAQTQMNQNYNFSLIVIEENQNFFPNPEGIKYGEQKSSFGMEIGQLVKAP